MKAFKRFCFISLLSVAPLSASAAVITEVFCAVSGSTYGAREDFATSMNTQVAARAKVLGAYDVRSDRMFPLHGSAYTMCMLVTFTYGGASGNLLDLEGASK